MIRALFLSLMFEVVRRSYAWGKNVLPHFHKAVTFFLPPPSSSSSQEEVPAIEQQSPLVIRVLGQNPGKFTLGGTNTFIVGTGTSRILIDTGEGRPAYVPALKKAMRDAGCSELSSILITHRHYDHIGGIKSLYEAFGHEIPTYKCMNHGESAGVSVDGSRWKHYDCE